MTRRTGVVTVMGLSGEEFRGKLMQRIGGELLCQRMMARLRRAAEADNIEEGPVGFTACIVEHDQPLLDVASQLGVDVITCAPRSWSTGTVEADMDSDLLHELRKRYDCVLCVNPCLPFLTLSSTRAFINRAKAAEGPRLAVFRRGGAVWDTTGARVIGAEGAPAIHLTGAAHFTSADCFAIYPIEFLEGPLRFRYDFVEVPRTLEYRIRVTTRSDLELARAYDAWQSSGGPHAEDGRMTMYLLAKRYAETGQ